MSRNAMLMLKSMEHTRKNLPAAIRVLKASRRVFTAGNGGSSANASHFAQDLLKACSKPAICLTDSTPALTAWSNDTSYTHALAEIFKAHEPSMTDCVCIFSGSGNSRNILQLALEAKIRKVPVIAFLGMGGGSLKATNFATVLLHVEEPEMEASEDAHQILFHDIVCELKKGRSKMANLQEWITKAQSASGSMSLTQEQIDDLHQALQDEIASSTPPNAVFIGVPIQVV